MPTTDPSRPEVWSQVDCGRDAFGFCIEEEGKVWFPALRLPVLSREAFGRRSLAELGSARIRVFLKYVGPFTFPAMCIRPGPGSARVPIPISAEEYIISAIGTWPTGIDRAPWTGTVGGFNEAGTLFRLRGGEWTRLSDAAAVRCGDMLYVLSREDYRPPADCPTEPMGESRLSPGWVLRKTTAPIRESPNVRAWLLSLGHRLMPSAWKMSVCSPPVDFSRADGRWRFPVGTAVPLILVPPPGVTEGYVRVAGGWNAGAGHEMEPRKDRGQHEGR